MTTTDIELKPLRAKQRKFIDLIVYKGLDRVEAYCEAFDKNIATGNPETLRVAATKIFYQPNVNNYYHACMESGTTKLRRASGQKRLLLKSS